MFFNKKVLGIDIGTDAIKLVEMSVFYGRKKLENYAEVKSSLLSKESLLKTDESGNLTSSAVIAVGIAHMLKEAKIKTKKTIFALPDFLTFATFFEIPQMPEKEIAGAVYYNVSRYLTLSLNDVTLDWRVMSHATEKGAPIKIFLVAIPNQIIKRYQEIAHEAGLELYALEPEVFGISRILAGKKEHTICFIDMGAQTSTINIVSLGVLKRSFSFNFSAYRVTAALAAALSVTLQEAEKIKITEGMVSQKEPVVKTIKSLVDSLVVEIKSIAADFTEQEKQPIDAFYLTGGTATLPGLKKYFLDTFKNPIEIPNCFVDIAHPKVLTESLVTMAPRFSVAVGVAAGVAEF